MIPIEQPPDDMPDEWKAYFNRWLVRLNLELEEARKLPDADQFTTAAYGGLSTEAEIGLSDLGATWQTVPFDALGVTNPRGITQDIVNDKLGFPYKGIYSVSMFLSLSHNEVNAGREMQIRVYNPDTATGGVGIVVGTGRNMSVTVASATILLEVSDTDPDNNHLQIQIRSATDSYTSVILESANFDANMVSERQF